MFVRNDVDWATAIQTITALAVLLVALVKPVVDAIKLAFPKLPSSAFPPLAVVTGIGMMLLLAVSTSTDITPQLVAQMMLASLISAVSAGGINRLHDKANDAIEQEQTEAAERERKAAEQAEAAEREQKAKEQAEAAERERNTALEKTFFQDVIPVLSKFAITSGPPNGGESLPDPKKP